MKIEYEKDIQKVRLEDVLLGQCFLFDPSGRENLWMRGQIDDLPVIVDLSDGEVRRIDLDEWAVLVTMVGAKVVGFFP